MARNGDRYILALDQGTTGTAALVFDRRGLPIAQADQEIRQFYPSPGRVEHDAEEIVESCLSVAEQAVANAGIEPGQVAALGITNQRETTVVWNRKTGRPIHRAIVWQDRRTAPLCKELVEAGLEPLIRERTGLLVDPYFSATKIRWLLDNVPNARRQAEAGELASGTIDSWLVWKLSDGALHVTDVSNASRTMLFNIHRQEWDQELLAELAIPAALLPRVCPSSGVLYELAGVARSRMGDAAIPMAGLAGDQHAALFGQACYRPGMSKNTYGTGSFLLMHVGERAPAVRRGLLTTTAWKVSGAVEYALEGSVLVTGGAVQWLRDGLGIISTPGETQALAESVGDTGGVYFVPAFAGLGAPYWDMSARGSIVGLTGGTRREHLVRATLEAIAYQTADVVATMREGSGVDVPVLRVDGGGTANGFLMQFQADVLGIPIEVAAVQETTARGAAYLAGLAVGFWPDQRTIEQQWAAASRFEPGMSADHRAELLAVWHRAVERARGWASD